MILDDVRPEGKRLTFLDIGCGHGFDGDVPLQESIARVAGTFIGIEPDMAVRPLPCFSQVHACLFEEWRQRRAGPLRVADRLAQPRLAERSRRQTCAAVAGAFQRHRDGGRRPRHEVIH